MISPLPLLANITDASYHYKLQKKWKIYHETIETCNEKAEISLFLKEILICEPEWYPWIQILCSLYKTNTLIHKSRRIKFTKRQIKTIVLNGQKSDCNFSSNTLNEISIDKGEMN